MKRLLYFSLLFFSLKVKKILLKWDYGVKINTKWPNEFQWEKYLHTKDHS